MTSPVYPSEFRLAEPLAALSVATDHVRGQPPGQALYKTIIATRLAEYLGLSQAECAVAYYATLLRAAGCTATSHEFALYLGGTTSPFDSVGTRSTPMILTNSLAC